jgi:Na+/H+ antiporter NhaD/arsenite permease-like protein
MGIASDDGRTPAKDYLLRAGRFCADKAKQNIIVVISVIAAVVTCFLVPPDKQYLGYIQYKTIACLLALMMLVSAIKHTNVFKIIAAAILKRIGNMRTLVTFLVFLPALFALVITNDVAIVTFVPFTIVLLQMCHKEKYLPKVLILMTFGCNLSPALSPLGAPQNLYLFDYFGLSPFWFAANLWPLAVMGYGSILIACLLTKNEEIRPVDAGRRAVPKLKLAVYFTLLLLVILAIFDFVKQVPLYYIIAPLVIVALLLMDRQVFIKTKYSIIVMFVAFFILAGNLARIPQVNDFLTGILEGNEFVLTVGLSQLVSNTTSTLLLSKFTTNYYAFIAGAVVSKFGSPISTMSNFMVTKFYSKYDIEKKFNLKFYLAEFCFLALLFATGMLMIYVLQPLLGVVGV